MELRVLDDDDHGRLATFLDDRIESSLFLRSNALLAGLVDGGEPYQGTYAGAFEGDALLGVAAHYWNGMVIAQAPQYTGEIVRFLVEASARAVSGVIGPWAQTQSALAALGITLEQLAINSREALYALALDTLKMPTPRPGQTLGARPAQMADIDTLFPWRVAYEEEVLNVQLNDEGRALAETRLKDPINVSGSSRGRLRRSQDEGRLHLFFVVSKFASGC